jgi:hypothetical protein
MGSTFQNLLGKPSFGIKAENISSLNNFQLWFYPPPSKFSSDNTVIYTVGLCEYYFISSCPNIELSFQVPGKHGRPQLEKLGMILGELIFDTLKIAHFTPNLLLTGLKRLLMPGMKDILVLEGAGIRPLWIEDEKGRNIRILQLLPVYEDELPLIRRMGYWNTYRSFIKHKINFFEPNRKSLSDVEYFPEELKLAREVGVYQPPPDMYRLTEQIGTWYAQNAPLLPAAKTMELPLTVENMEKVYGIRWQEFEKEPSSRESENAEIVNNLWERLYSGYYKKGENNTIIKNPHFFPSGAVNHTV